MIIRGIGYRAFLLVNDFVNQTKEVMVPVVNKTIETEFLYSRYLLIRAGHTTDLYQGVPESITIKTSKKDRKLIISGPDKSLVNYLAMKVVSYRKPSVYTGRGVRLKKAKQIRKAGKQDKQKGKGF